MVRNETYEERYDSWEALKLFLREYDHKQGDYSEVTFNLRDLPFGITLSEEEDGSIVINSVYYNNLSLEGKITEVVKKLTRYEIGPHELTLTSERGAIPFEDRSCVVLTLIYFEEDEQFIMDLKVQPEIHFIDLEKVADIEYSRGAVHEIGDDYERDDYLELKLREFQGNTWREINLELP